LFQEFRGGIRTRKMRAREREAADEAWKGRSPGGNPALSVRGAPKALKIQRFRDFLFFRKSGADAQKWCTRIISDYLPAFECFTHHIDVVIFIVILSDCLRRIAIHFSSQLDIAMSCINDLGDPCTPERMWSFPTVTGNWNLQLIAQPSVVILYTFAGNASVIRFTRKKERTFRIVLVMNLLQLLQ